METIRIRTSQNIDIDYEVASVGDRILAYLIDLAIFFVIYILLLIIGLMGMDGFGNVGIGIPIILIILLLIYGTYDLICETCMNGQSIGKRVRKIRVISTDGRRPTIGQYLIRWLMRLVDISLTVGAGAVLSIVLSEKKQRLGDIAAGTTLVSTQSRLTSSQLIFNPSSAEYIPVFATAAALHEQDVVLINEVLANFHKSHNYELVDSMAERIKQLLEVEPKAYMDNLTFLKTIILDYNHFIAGH